MKVVVLATAEARLRAIVIYARLHNAPGIAEQIVERLEARLKHLELFPRIGPLEEWLVGSPGEHRRLVEGNYKIIYRIEEDTVFITDVFDTRRDPDDMTP